MNDRLPPVPGWHVATLGDLFEIKDRERIPINGDERAKRPGAIPYYGATGQVGWIDDFIFDEELVLLGEDGAPFLQGSKSKAYVIRGRAWVNNHAHVLRALASTPSSFWKYQLDQVDYHGFVSGTTRLKLSQRPMRQIPLLVPPYEEQHRIVDALESYFTRLDDAVATLERVQRNLKRYRASVLKAAVEGRLVPTEAELARAEGRDYEPASVLLERILAERRRRWEEAELAKMKAKGKVPKDDGWKGRYKEPAPPDISRPIEIPDGWCWASVEQLGFIASGQTPKGVTTAGAQHGDIPWFRVGDMNAEMNQVLMTVATEWLTTDQVATLGLHVRPAGTIIFPKRGGAISTNKKRVLAQPATYDLNTMGIVPVADIRTYLWVWFLGLDLGSLADGSNVPQINHGDIAPLPVPLPPAAEQDRIVNEVNANLSIADDVTAAVSANRLRSKHLRQSILKWAFEGRLVDQDPTDEPASALLQRIQAEREATTPEKRTSSPRRRRKEKTA